MSIGESPVLSSVTWTASIFFVSTSTITWSLTNPLRTFHLCLIHSPLLCCFRPVESTARRTGTAPPPVTVNTLPFLLFQCLEPWCSRACPSHRASQSAFPAGACTAAPSSILPPPGPQTVTRRTGTARPPCSLLTTVTSSCLCGSSRMISAWPRLTYFSLSVISNLCLIH